MGNELERALLWIASDINCGEKESGQRFSIHCLDDSHHWNIQYYHLFQTAVNVGYYCVCFAAKYCHNLTEQYAMCMW